MAKYPSVKTTRVGRDAISQANASGQALKFTKVVIGSGDATSGAEGMTQLVRKQMDLPIIKSVNLGNGLFTVTAALDNTKLNSGFDAKELGLMAKVGDNGTEVLFSYTNGGNYVDYIPDKNTVMDTYTFTITTVIGNAENVTAIHTDEGLTPLLTFNQHLQDADAHADVFSKYLALAGGTVTGPTSFRSTLTALTKSYTDNSTNVATTAFVQSLFTNFLTQGQSNNTKLRDAVKAANLAGYHGITQDVSNPNSWWIKLPSGVIIQGIKITGITGSALNNNYSEGITNVTYPIAVNSLLGFSTGFSDTARTIAEHASVNASNNGARIFLHALGEINIELSTWLFVFGY